MDIVIWHYQGGAHTLSGKGRGAVEFAMYICTLFKHIDRAEASLLSLALAYCGGDC